MKLREQLKGAWLGIFLALGLVAFFILMSVRSEGVRPGAMVAAVPVAVKEPFTLELVSDGTPMRMWVDLKCGSNFDPDELGGTIEVRVGGAVVATYVLEHEIGRFADYHREGGAEGDEYRGILLGDLPPTPAGATVVITGTLDTLAVWGNQAAAIDDVSFWIAP